MKMEQLIKEVKDAQQNGFPTVDVAVEQVADKHDLSTEEFEELLLEAYFL